MLVKKWMSRAVITVDENDSVADALRLTKQNNTRLLPVTREHKLVGIVTDRDLKRASCSDIEKIRDLESCSKIPNTRVSEIMITNPITVPFDYTIEETAELLLESKIAGVPVVDSHNGILGVVTKTDLFKVLTSLTGVGKKGIQFALEVKDRPGVTNEIDDTIRTYGGRIVSILSSYEGDTKAFRKIYIRARNLDRLELEPLKKELRKMAVLLYMVDHRENKREVYYH